MKRSKLNDHPKRDEIIQHVLLEDMSVSDISETYNISRHIIDWQKRTHLRTPLENSRKYREKNEDAFIKEILKNNIGEAKRKTHFDVMSLCKDFFDLGSLEHNYKNKISVVDLAYLAGYFDADGCYNISKRWNKYGYKKGKYITYQIQLKYTGTEKHTMLWIYKKLKIMGCSPRLCVEGERDEYKTRYNVFITNKNGTRIFLKALKPFLITKTKPVNFTSEKQEYLDKSKIPYW